MKPKEFVLHNGLPRWLTQTLLTQRKVLALPWQRSGLGIRSVPFLSGFSVGLKFHSMILENCLSIFLNGCFLIRPKLQIHRRERHGNYQGLSRTGYGLVFLRTILGSNVIGDRSHNSRWQDARMWFTCNRGNCANIIGASYHPWCLAVRLVS